MFLGCIPLGWWGEQAFFVSFAIDRLKSSLVTSRSVSNPYLHVLLGTGMKQLHTARADKAEEALIEAGHLSRQAVAKSRKKAKEAARKKTEGLDEDNGAFKGAARTVTTMVKMTVFSLHT